MKMKDLRFVLFRDGEPLENYSKIRGFLRKIKQSKKIPFSEEKLDEQLRSIPTFASESAILMIEKGGVECEYKCGIKSIEEYLANYVYDTN